MWLQLAIKNQGTKAEPGFAVLWWTCYYDCYHTQNWLQRKDKEAILWTWVTMVYDIGSYLHPGYKWMYQESAIHQGEAGQLIMR